MQAGICFVCMNALKDGVSVKKDFPICQPCFDQLYQHERQTIRKLVFKEADHIIDNIFLGPETSAINLEYLRSNNIDRVLAAALYVEMPFTDPVHQIEYLYLQIDDSPTENIFSHLSSVIDFIEKRPHTNVLVHCVSGISRSGACVIAYVMKKKGLKYEEAWEFVKSKRSIVHPNSGFKAQLKRFQTEVLNI